jgi:hypothetical protein
MSPARRLACAVALLALTIVPAHGSVYRTAHGLYRDCSAGTDGNSATAKQKLRSCADFLNRIFNNWNLNQDNGVCSRHFGNELPKAYVEYWRVRGLGPLDGLLTSAVASANQFLDSQRQACPTPDLMTSPP